MIYNFSSSHQCLIKSATFGFQMIHGLVDRIMEVNGAAFVAPDDNTGYFIKPSNVSFLLTVSFYYSLQTF